MRCQVFTNESVRNSHYSHYRFTVWVYILIELLIYFYFCIYYDSNNPIRLLEDDLKPRA